MVSNLSWQSGMAAAKLNGVDKMAFAITENAI